MYAGSSSTNTHLPRFSNTAQYLHQLGNALVWTCHWGFDQLMRFSDPINPHRSEAMDQFPLPVELPAKVFRLAFGLAAFVGGIPASDDSTIRVAFNINTLILCTMWGEIYWRSTQG